MDLSVKDCIIYKSKSIIDFDKFKSSYTPYEKFDVKDYSSEIKTISYTWIDPIRVRDKIIAKDKRSIVLVYLFKKNIIACFGTSESQIGYVVNRIEKVSKVNLGKIDIFKDFSNIITTQPITVHLQMGDNYYDDTLDNPDLIKVKVKDLQEKDLENYFAEGKVVLLTFKFLTNNNMFTYFYIDRGSVLTFPDTEKEDVIYNVLEKIFNIY